jgi:hypothetical protein
MKRCNFYVTDFDANGKQDLIVTDRFGGIIARRDKSIYGLHVNFDKGFPALNTSVITDLDMRKSLLDAPNAVTFVYQASPQVLMRHVEAGNCQETIEFIQKYEQAK